MIPHKINLKNLNIYGTTPGPGGYELDDFYKHKYKMPLHKVMKGHKP